jgi:hypothetical protein
MSALAHTTAIAPRATVSKQLRAASARPSLKAKAGYAANDFFGSGLPDNKPVQTSGGYSSNVSAPPAPAKGGNDFFGSGLPSNDTWNSGGSSAPQASAGYAANDFFGSGLPDNKPVQTSAPQQSYSAPQQSSAPAASNDFFGSGLPGNKPVQTSAPQQSYSAPQQSYSAPAASNDFFGSGLPDNKPVQTSAPQQSYSAPAPRASTGGAFFADHTPRVEPPSTTYSQSIANQPVIRPASRGFFDDW